MTRNDDDGELRVEVDLMSIRLPIPEESRNHRGKAPLMDLWYASYNDLQNRQVELLWTMGKRPLMFVYDGSRHRSVGLDLLAAQNWAFLAKKEQIKEGAIYYRYALRYRLGKGGGEMRNKKQSHNASKANEAEEVERALKEGLGK